MVSSAVYRYFPNKDELLTTLIIDGYNAVGAAVEKAEALHGDVSVPRVAIVSARIVPDGMDEVHGLRLPGTVHVDEAIAQLEMIAGHADQALDEEQVGLAGLEEHDDVVAPRLPVVD